MWPFNKGWPPNGEPQKIKVAADLLGRSCVTERVIFSKTTANYISPKR